MKKLFILTLAASAVAPAFADNVPPATSGDPNEVVCRSVSVIGSRLARQRRCVTRAQWAADDATEREALRRGQMTQMNPQNMSRAERMRVNGQYNPLAGRGSPSN